MSVSLDTLLDGSVHLHQYASGYRAGLDAVFLAAACSIQPHQSLLDVGCGVGAAFLCVAARIANLHITGIEAESAYADLAIKNAEHNHQNARILTYALPQKPDPIGPQRFDHVITNPPYWESDFYDPSPVLLKEKAFSERETPFSIWIDFCLRKLKDRGTLTLIFPTARLNDILVHTYGRLGEIGIFPLWSSEHISKRVLIRGRKTVQGSCTLYPGMRIHGSDGSYTPQAQEILKHGHPLIW